MTHINLRELCDIATSAHTRFQQEIEDIDPVVGVSHNMRDSGVPADAMTIDCLKSNKRIIIILHDHQPNTVNYQFAWRDKDLEEGFKQIEFDSLNSDILFDWMKTYLTV